MNLLHVTELYRLASDETMEALRLDQLHCSVSIGCDLGSLQRVEVIHIKASVVRMLQDSVTSRGEATAERVRAERAVVQCSHILTTTC